MKYYLNFVILVFGLISGLGVMQGCVYETTTNTEVDLSSQRVDTTKIVIVVIDGPRYVDTWGKEGQPHIPKMADSLLPQGLLFTNFKNNRHTYTLAGHAALLTGNYQAISNDGSEPPKEVSLLHHYLKQTTNDSSKTAIVTSKSKLEVLAQTKDHEWKSGFIPYTNSGKNGEDREDTETFEEVINTLKTKKPNVMLVQFKGPDTYGHANDWEGYMDSIEETDSLVYELWRYLQMDTVYQNKTALLITNDHGRHLPGHRDGFVSHGDLCEGCKHISLLALGPDFAKNKLITEEYELVDIAPTVAALLGIKIPTFDNSNLIIPLLERPDEEHAYLGK